METTSNPTVSVFGIDFDLTVLAMSLLTVIIVFGVVFWASRKMSIKPKGKQNVLEFIYEFVNSTISQNLGKFTKNYSLLLFVIPPPPPPPPPIGLLVSVKSEHYNFWSSPTSNFGVTITLSLIVTLISHIEGIRKKGFKGYLKGYLSPYPAMLPMNILEQLTNLASLALRLFGNIYSGEVLTGLILQLVTWSVFAAPVSFALNLVWVAFSTFIGFIQAYVFIILSSNYIGDKVNEE